jgi:anaerobic magnesium-protoporphyrin IX monomethyl ester cyclase
MSHEEIIDRLRVYQPQFIGLYSTAFGWEKAKKTAAAIKAVLSQVFIVVGGPYPVAVQEKCLQDCPDIDAVVTGEGEITVVEMIARLESARNFDGVEGVAFRLGNEIKKNSPRPLITDLDALPFPARDLLGEAAKYIPPPATYKRKPVAVIMTARGCNRHCLYCFQLDKNRASGIRYRSVENVMAEIELVLSQGYREIKFIDDTLTADYHRAMSIAGEIKKRGLDFIWFASAVVNQVDKPLLQAFKEAGCWAILFGAESGVQKNLNAIRKGITPDQIRRAVKAAKEVGITVYTPFLFGIPGQTFEDGLKTIEFALELDPDIANFHAITPFPGTELYDNIEKYGTMSEDLTDYTYQGAAFVPYTMTREQIAELRQLALKKFYSRPKFLWRRFLALRSLNDLRVAWQGLKSLFWLQTKKDLFKHSQ